MRTDRRYVAALEADQPEPERRLRAEEVERWLLAADQTGH